MTTGQVPGMSRSCIAHERPPFSFIYFLKLLPPMWSKCTHPSSLFLVKSVWISNLCGKAKKFVWSFSELTLNLVRWKVTLSHKREKSHTNKQTDTNIHNTKNRKQSICEYTDWVCLITLVNYLTNNKWALTWSWLWPVVQEPKYEISCTINLVKLYFLF